MCFLLPGRRCFVVLLCLIVLTCAGGTALYFALVESAHETIVAMQRNVEPAVSVAHRVMNVVAAAATTADDDQPK